MNPSDAQTYRCAVLYADFADPRPSEVVEAPLLSRETHELVAAVATHSGTLLECSGRRLYALFDKSDDALVCAQQVRNIVNTVRDSDPSRRSLCFRQVLGYGLVTNSQGRLRSDWTYRLPGQTALLPANSLGALPEFVAQIGGPLKKWLKPVPGSSGTLFLISSRQLEANTTRKASGLDLAEAAFFASITLRVRGVPQTVRSSDCPVTIGRDPTSGVCVSGDTVSRHHGRIDYEHGKFLYVDESRNGTYVLTPAGDELFLLGESLALVGEGAISPGSTVNQQTGDLVRYDCRSTRLSMSDGIGDHENTRTMRLR